MPDTSSDSRAVLLPELRVLAIALQREFALPADDGGFAELLDKLDAVPRAKAVLAPEPVVLTAKVV